METLKFETYEVFRKHFGESEAALVMEYIDSNKEDGQKYFAEHDNPLQYPNKKNNLLMSDFRQELNLVRMGLEGKINSAITETNILKAELKSTIYTTGLIQIVALEIAVVAIFIMML